MAKDKNKTEKIVSYDTVRTTDGDIHERFDLAEYSKLKMAFDFFNKELFDEKLPDVFFTIQQHSKTAGFFRPEAFKERKFDENGEMLPPGFTLHEIAMMPEVFEFRTDREILSTIVHEMTHLQQQEFGKPSRKGYHNRQWAQYMKDVGLQPSTCGKHDKRNPERKAGPDDIEGAETGQSVSHFIIAAGKFDIACKKLIESGFKFGFHSVARLRQKAKKSKFKFTCPECRTNAWAKKDVKLACGFCNVAMVIEDDGED